jgi:hypothetical protein
MRIVVQAWQEMLDAAGHLDFEGLETKPLVSCKENL